MARQPKLRAEGLPYSLRNFDVVAMGASAGGLGALSQVLRALPRNFPSSIVVVQHLAPGHKSWIANLLGRSTTLKVRQAEHGEILLPGTVYTAPPDEHLLLGPGKSSWRIHNWCIFPAPRLTCSLNRWPEPTDPARLRSC